MGPSIVLDKSTLQSLSHSELILLHKYFTVNITPILIIEILGDLKKDFGEENDPKQKVTELSKKLIQFDSFINVHYRDLVIYNLLGNEVTMDGRPIVSSSRAESKGKKGVIVDELPEEKALNRWKIGEFLEVESILSERYREASRSIDYETLKNKYKYVNSILKEKANISEIIQIVDNILVMPGQQQFLMEFIMYEFMIDSTTASQIFYRWETEQPENIKDFAPYANFCFRINLIFYLGLIRNVIGTRATNRIDLQYAYYLPFCNIFSSNDLFHRDIIPYLLTDYNEFIIGEKIKKDLKIISETKHKEVIENDKNKSFKYPPDDTLVSQLWSKYFTLGKYPKRESDSPDDEIDYIIIKKYVSVDEPCFCGSGKKLKDCHLAK